MKYVRTYIYLHTHLVIPVITKYTTQVFERYNLDSTKNCSDVNTYRLTVSIRLQGFYSNVLFVKIFFFINYTNLHKNINI